MRRGSDGDRHDQGGRSEASSTRPTSVAPTRKTGGGYSRLRASGDAWRSSVKRAMTLPDEECASIANRAGRDLEDCVRRTLRHDEGAARTSLIVVHLLRAATPAITSETSTMDQRQQRPHRRRSPFRPTSRSWQPVRTTPHQSQPCRREAHRRRSDDHLLDVPRQQHRTGRPCAAVVAERRQRRPT